jgi:hypothetical protein
MRYLVILSVLIPNLAISGIHISRTIEAPFTSYPQSRATIDEMGNKTNVFIEIKSMSGKKSILYLIGQTDILDENISWNPLTGWEDRVIKGKNSTDSGINFQNPYAFDSSDSVRELRYIVKVTDPKMKRHFSDGFGFASGRRLNSKVFVQIGAECYGYSKLACERLYEKFRGNVRFNY